MIANNAEEEFEDGAQEGAPVRSLPPNGLEPFARKNPLAAMMGALVIGILLGRFGIL